MFHLIPKTQTIALNIDSKSRASPIDAVVQVIAFSSKALEVIQKNGLDVAASNPPSLGNSLALVLKWLWVGHHPGFVTTGVD